MPLAGAAARSHLAAASAGSRLSAAGIVRITSRRLGKGDGQVNDLSLQRGDARAPRAPGAAKASPPRGCFGHSLALIFERLRKLLNAYLYDVGHDAVAQLAEERERLPARVERALPVAEGRVAEREVVERVGFLLPVAPGADRGQRVAKECERLSVVQGGAPSVARRLVQVAGLRQRVALAGHVARVAVDLDGATDVTVGAGVVLQFEIDAAGAQEGLGLVLAVAGLVIDLGELVVVLDRPLLLRRLADEAYDLEKRRGREAGLLLRALALALGLARALAGERPLALRHTLRRLCARALALGLRALFVGGALLLDGLLAFFLRDLLLVLGLCALLVGVTLLQLGEALLLFGVGALPLRLVECRAQIAERRLALARVEVCAAGLFDGAVALRQGHDRQRGHQREDDGRDGGGAQHTAAVGRALSAHLGVGHVGDDPCEIEDAFINPVADSQQSALRARDAGEAERAHERVGLVVRDAAAPAEARVSVQERRAIRPAAQKSFADEEQVVVALARAVREEQFFAEAVNARRRSNARVLGHGEAEPLREIRMAARPIEHAAQQVLTGTRLATEARGERSRFLLGEVGQLDSASDVEGRGARVAYEVGGRGDAEQAEGEARELRLLSPAVVELAYRGEELVGREREAAHRVYLVNEDDDAARRAREHDLAERPCPALQRPLPLVVEPEVFQLVFEAELLSEPREQAVVPLLRREVLADGGQVEHGDSRAALAQTRGGANHQTRLAHLPRRERVAEVAREKFFVQREVGPALDVRRRVAPERSARDVEAGQLLCAHRVGKSCRRTASSSRRPRERPRGRRVRVRLEEVAFEVHRVEMAARLQLLRRVARHDARAAQTVEGLVRRARIAFEHRARDVREHGVSGEQHQYAPQVVAVRALLSIRHRLEVVEADSVRDHLVQAAAHEVRVAAEQRVEARELFNALDGRAVPRVQLPDLLRREVLKF